MSFSTLVSGQDEYPTNFDCEYQVTAPRTEGSCYEIHIEHPFSLETSRSCRNDRLEIFNILNAADISMDPAADDTTAVLCGNGMFYGISRASDWKPVLSDCTVNHQNCSLHI